MSAITAISVADLAKRLEARVQGDGDRMIHGVNTLKDAGPDELSFLANPKYVDQVKNTRAGAILVHEQHAQLVQTALVSQNPYLDFARTVQMFAKPQGSFKGQSPLAYIHPQAKVDPSVTVYPFVFVGSGAEIGAETTLFSGVYVGEDSRVGRQCTLYPNSVIMAGTVLGDRVVLHPGAVAGSDGFGFAQGENGIEKFPQVGRAVLEDDADIGANTAIDRAALGVTRIGKGTKIDNLVQIGHNVTVGQNCLIVAQVGIAGSTTIGDRVLMGGQSAVAGHIEVGSGCRMAAKTGLSKSLPPNSDVSGIPAMDHKTFLRVAVTLPKLPDMVRRLRALERELSELKGEKRQGDDGGER